MALAAAGEADATGSPGVMLGEDATVFVVVGLAVGAGVGECFSHSPQLAPPHCASAQEQMPLAGSQMPRPEHWSGQARDWQCAPL